MSTAADKPVCHILALSGGKAASCARALDMLGPILTRHYPKLIIGGSVWHGFSLADIHTFSRSGPCLSSRRGRRSIIASR